MPKFALVAAVLCLLSLAHGDTDAVGAQPSAPAPALFLPAAEELGSGFSVQFGDISVDDINGARRAIRQYVRQNTSVAADDVTESGVSVTVASDESDAQVIFTRFVQAAEGESFSITGLQGIGDEAAVARRVENPSRERPDELVRVYFRIGAVSVTVVWREFVDLPNFEDAMRVAWLVEGKIQAYRASLTPAPVK